MSSFYANYPASSSSSNASTGSTGVTAPTSATEIGFIDGGGLLQPLTGTVANGPLVNVSSSALPTGSATSALQITGNTSLSAIATSVAAATPAGTNVIGKVSIDQTTPGTTNLVALAANQSVNVGQINAITPLMGNGVTGTGSQRVTIASDNTAFAVNATLQTAANVIGKVSIDQTTPGTTNLVALAANQSVNVAQINAITPLMGNGVTGTGSQRVTIASDNTAFAVKPSTPTAGTVTQAAISVGTSAVRMTVSGSAPSATRSVLMAIVDSASTAKFYIGSATVSSTSTTRGFQISAGMPFVANNDAGDYYIISDTTAQTVYVTEQA